MSPQEAIRNPVVHFYVALTLGLLLIASGPLYLLRKRAESAWQAYCGWLWIVPITGLSLFLGRETTIVFFTVVGVAAFFEFARAVSLSDPFLIAGVLLGILFVGVTAWVPNPIRGGPGWYDFFVGVPVFVVAGLLAIPVLRNRSEGQLHAVTLAIFGFLYFGWMFGHVALLANAKHAYAYLLYLLFAVQLNDVAAFLCGKALGRHPLRSNISPNKTWEGALSALVFSLALPWALWWTFPHLRCWDLLAVGVIVGVGGQMGDLVSSAIKRDVGIKDMGTLLPGHGGILDRIDSLIYTAPAFFHYLHYRQELGFSM